MSVPITQEDNVEIMSCSHLSYIRSDKEMLITIAELTRYCGGILVRLVMHLFWGEKYKDLWFYTLFYIFILYLYSS